MATGPFITSQRPERSLEVGSLAGQFLADLIDGLTSHLHEMEAVEDDLGLREELARSALMAGLISMLMSSILFSLCAIGRQGLSEGFQV